MENAIGHRPSKLRVLRAYYALCEEPVDHVQDDSAGVGEDLRCHRKSDVAFVQSPCYPQAHRDHSNLTETWSLSVAVGLQLWKLRNTHKCAIEDKLMPSTFVALENLKMHNAEGQIDNEEDDRDGDVWDHVWSASETCIFRCVGRAPMSLLALSRC